MALPLRRSTQSCGEISNAAEQGQFKAWLDKAVAMRFTARIHGARSLKQEDIYGFFTSLHFSTSYYNNNHNSTLSTQ